ncbi:hypothetical protein GCM10007938_37560 [Vibrio zhanjiangensis]|uniref:Uncharacterized protein n=1 Tax=Vibrio zhanjiangensis TaxID=1046128 RepID=A0ABQ6F380_9VIBR|nr:hypothetical protein [Vibrio zhanjiangensis]GLT19973.1 hypothetical protein GCM10007938_37560 [Vibrio zhanjiangensis]
MAAEKLTLGRFAQIIIMLTLLVAAFTWRTLDYVEPDKLECNLTPKCTVNINDSSLIAYLEGETLIVSKPVGEWTMISQDPSLVVETDNERWKVHISAQQAFEFYFKTPNTDNPLKVSFRR